MDLEVARRGQQWRQVRVGVVESARADEPVAAPAVPPPQELLARVRPPARHEQLELHGPQPAAGAAVLDMVEQRAADAHPALIGGGDEHPKLADVGGHVLDAHAAHDPAVAGGDDDLPAADELGDLRGGRSRAALAPEPLLGDRVDAVDEIGQPFDEPAIVGGPGRKDLDGDWRLLRRHASRMPARIERSNT
jgi:hypothetical protein